jgi:hypothetical protein
VSGVGVVVAGAAGGCGATTLACAMALGHAQGADSPTVIGAGAVPGGPSDLWGLPAVRTLDDLLPLGDDLGPGHIAQVAHSHASGARVIVGPRSPGAAAAWQGDALQALVSGIAASGTWVADAGRAGTPLAAALATRAHLVVVVVPGRVGAVGHAVSLIESLSPARVAVVASPLPAADELSARAMRRALGGLPVIGMPVDRRGAADLIAARMPSRGGLARTVAELAAVA